MWPNDLRAIYSRLKTLNTQHGFKTGSRPYIFQEVIDNGGEAVKKQEYNDFAAVTEFGHGHEISNAMRGNNLLKWFVSWGEAWNLLPSKDALVFIDNHDTQRGDSNILTYKSSKLYKVCHLYKILVKIQIRKRERSKSTKLHPYPNARSTASNHVCRWPLPSCWRILTELRVS